MSKNMKYDAREAGSIQLDSHVCTFNYVKAALNEMKELIREIKQPAQGHKLIHQTLPKHMRRRMMSHHPNRLPRKYRSAHICQMSKSGTPKQKKRPSRKYRRRHKNLLNAYLRRQRKIKWLETHIWHAKRFHMIERWGYRLPYARCNKMYRASYRATTQHCLLQDISFYACIEMCGPFEQLKNGFHRLNNQACGLSITAKTFTTGRREGCVDFFKDGQYPYKALGKVNFMWCPSKGTEDSRILWLWIHPCDYNSILEELVKVFGLTSTKVSKILLDGDDSSRTSTENESAKNGKNRRRLQFMTKIITRQNVPTYKNNETAIVLKELKDTMNRFRLTGPLSQSILYEAFNVKNLTNCMQEKIENGEQWYQNVIQEDNTFLESHNKQKEFWELCKNNMTSPCNFLSNAILALNIEDPRLRRPQNRTKAICAPKDNEDMLSEHSVVLSYSPLWQQPIRDRVSKEMLSTHNYSKLRAEYAIVPGKPCTFEDSIQPVPIILIQRPGVQQTHYTRLSYGYGWDIISPAGYGMPIWITLIMWGARVGGLREFETIFREMGTEQHLPDTVGGKQMASMKYEELRNKYFRLPPNKRCNYQKLCIVSPFRVPFDGLIRDWNVNTHEDSSTNCEKMYVLRDRKKLEDIIDSVNGVNTKKFPSDLPSGCLLQLKFTLKNRGNPKNYALVCLPIKQDFKRHMKNIYYHENNSILSEPPSKDPNAVERKKLRIEHKKLLKRLRRRRVREKRKVQETSTTQVFIRPARTLTICTQQYKKMCSLWLPEDCSAMFSVRKQSCRETIGYLTLSSFCLTEGIVCGIGYVTLEGLKQLIEVNQQQHIKQQMCLIRATNSRHYRFASFKVNLDV